jgi:CDP-2,3-bis-(O-geranylgeranyl)-sn-glycerol synthase
MLGFGAMTGDSVGSFIKRRFDLKRGQKAPLLDQLDFLFGALLMASLFVTIKLEWIILLTVITPLIHLVASIIAYRLKVKKEPW